MQSHVRYSISTLSRNNIILESYRKVSCTEWLYDPPKSSHKPWGAPKASTPNTTDAKASTAKS